VTRRLTILLLALGTMIQAGCGGSGSSSSNEAGKSAAVILADARQAARDAGSVRVAGTIHDSGQTIGLDLKIAQHGGGGTMTIQGSKVEIVRVGKSVYIRAPSSFYERVGAGKAAGQLLAGKWLKAPASTSDFRDLAQLTNINQFVSQALKPEGTVTKGGETTVAGQKAIELKSSKGGSLFVATTGKPYPIELKGVGSSSGTLKLTDWGSVSEPAAPKGAVDIGSVGK
jgi:hypothetical protein